jgi:TP901 family phage tail tape measure protein
MTIKDMINNIRELDAAITELQKTSDISGDSLAKFVQDAADMGKQIGRTVKDVIDATATFSKAGYTLKESFDLAKSALVMTNVGDGINSVADASSALISVLKGFKMEDSMAIVDMINEVSNKSSIDFQDITNGLRRVSGTLSQTGTSIQQTIGLLTGGFGSLRDIEMVSSGKQTAPYVQKCA